MGCEPRIDHDGRGHPELHGSGKRHQTAADCGRLYREIYRSNRRREYGFPDPDWPDCIRHNLFGGRYRGQYQRPESDESDGYGSRI